MAVWRRDKPASIAALGISEPYTIATGTLIATSVVLSIFLSSEPLSLILIGAVLCGWSELDGACGTSHVAAITPLRSLTAGRKLWLTCIAGYHVAGTLSSLLMGALLGLAGLLVGHRFSSYAQLLGIVLAIVLAAREVGMLSLTLPQIHRQTQKMWAVRFGLPTGAAMWGAHIGIGVATVIQHGGIYVIALTCAIVGPIKGAALMAAFWFGRALPIWVTPLLRLTAADGGVLVDATTRSQRSLRHSAAVGLLILGAALFALSLPDGGP